MKPIANTMHPSSNRRLFLNFSEKMRILSQLASEHGIHHSLLVRWRSQALDRDWPP